MAWCSQGMTDSLVTETLRLSIASGGESKATATASQHAAGSRATATASQQAAGSVVNVAADPLTGEAARAVDELGSDDDFQRATRQEYGLLKQWLDQTHKGWEARCGLAPVVLPDGSVEWMPPADAPSSPLPRSPQGTEDDNVAHETEALTQLQRQRLARAELRT